MNDSPQWRSPESAAPKNSGASGPPEVPPAYGASGGASPASGSWTPPPKPGLIPLRPLDLGAILAGAFKTMRQNPKATFGTALLIQGGVTLLAVGVVGLVTYLSLSRIDSATAADQPEILAGSFGVIALSAIIPLFLSLAASALLQGVIVLNVMRASLGEKPTLPTLLRMAKGRIWALIGWTLLVILAATVAFAVLVGIIAALAALGGVIGVLFAVLVGLGGGLGYLVIWVWLSTKLSLVPSVLMAERLGIGASIKRSWALTRNAFWKTFGIELLVSAIIGIATQIVVTPISLVAGFVTPLTDPNSQNPSSAITSVIIVNLVIVAVSVVFGAIGAVIQSSTVALIYIDLRMRKEGLDLDLAHFVEARQRGEAQLSDPYLRHTAAEGSDQGSARPSSGTATNESPWA